MPSSPRPETTATDHPLPFERLSPADFERLCLWLVEREGYERAEALGEAGSEQGRDVVAWKDGRRIAFQCKRVRQFGPRDARAEIAKIRGLPEEEKPGLPEEEQPEELVFVVTSAVSAKTRKAARTAWGDEETCSFWAGTELDHKVKRHPEVVAEFFRLSEAAGRFVVRERGIGIAGDVAGSQVISGDRVTVNIYGGQPPEDGSPPRAVRDELRPRYPDKRFEKLSGRLRTLFGRRKELTIAGEDTRLVEGEILAARERPNVRVSV